MEKYILQKQDYEDSSFLINISKSIEDIYNELNKAENKFGNASNEYKNVLTRLKSLLNLENNIYNRFKNNFYKCEAVINYLTNLNEYKIAKNSYDLLFDETYNLEIARIIIKLNNYMIETSHNFVLHSNFNNEAIKDRISIASDYTLKIFSALQLDNLRCFLAIIKKEKLNELSTYMKYKISYLFPQIEEEFLNNNFEVNNNPYVLSQLVTDLFSQNKTLLNNIRLSEFMEIFNEQINSIIQINNFDLKKLKIKNNLLLRIYFLRAVLIFIDKDTVEGIHNSIKSYIMGQFNDIDNVKNSLNFINECFEHQKEDVEVPKVLTLKKF